MTHVVSCLKNATDAVLEKNIVIKHTAAFIEIILFSFVFQNFAPYGVHFSGKCWQHITKENIIGDIIRNVNIDRLNNAIQVRTYKMMCVLFYYLLQCLLFTTCNTDVIYQS